MMVELLEDNKLLLNVIYSILHIMLHRTLFVENGGNSESILDEVLNRMTKAEQWLHDLRQ